VSRHPLNLRALGALALTCAALTGCGSSSDNKSSGSGDKNATSNVSGTLSIVGVWTAEEQKSFQAVLDGFKAKYPKITV
jgi:alpha-glucoside transport system substrate-binding protein